MYEPGTILELKEQREPDEETGEEFPYNRVKVVGPSPVDHGLASAEWEGPNGAGVIVTPETNFGSTLDEPYGKLQALYNVVSVPETIIPEPGIRVIHSTSGSAGPTPEEVFAKEAPGTAPEEGQKRGRTPFQSPLEDPRKPANSSPLD
jgi:hypothetical protein